MFGKLRAWGREHPAVVDLLTIAPLVFVALALVPEYVADPVGESTRFGVPGVLALSGVLLTPLLWRRRFPRETFAVVAGISFLQWLVGIEPLPANLAVLVGMYGVAARCRLEWAVGAAAVVEFGTFLALRSWNDLSLEVFINASVFMLAVWFAGIYANMRRRYVQGLEERAERAERERDQQALIATAAERARIARELHDVVAHNVSVIVVQADGAGFAIDSDPEQARRAVQAISATGRQALTEMRRLVGVLRDDAASAEDYQPQPGLAQLEELVRQVRESGLPVEMTIDGDLSGLPEGEQLVIYRIVQEALTNSLKHGGPGARAEVQVESGGREIVVRVVDDGRGAAARVSEGGHGLIGMRERVTMYGGTMDAAPRIGGGFLVVARLPAVVREGAA
ncbi:two-component sensor histidine kinase [Acrocarpospora phusangensis]|uniref:histidine kinase n=1 Tax=Acrocarpospora phusangensis TaxID=1070424 RepID=A0A919QDL9_9ACTN|nr:sensor histidine kinase [Acrocarpospora phusangensis]GIH27269.1 two-component sensor histidine kinase [Acrocarpospora phusangensis]